MKISIIIPVYNVERYIDRCIISVLDQTYQNLEIILVDDCGNDQSMYKAESAINNHINKSKVIIIKHDQNRGLSAARNTGINTASGDYIYFLDSDDALYPNSIEKLATLVKNNESIDCVIANFDIINDLQQRFKSQSIKTQLLETNKKVLTAYANGDWPVMAWNKLIKLSFLIKNKLFFEEGILHEDILWSFTLANLANKIEVIDDKTYQYYLHEDSITGKIRQKNIDSYFFILNYINDSIVNQKALDRWENRIIGERVRNDLFRAIFSSNIKNKYESIVKLKNIKIRIADHTNYRKKIINIIFLLPNIICYVFLYLIRKF